MRSRSFDHLVWRIIISSDTPMGVQGPGGKTKQIVTSSIISLQSVFT